MGYLFVFLIFVHFVVVASYNRELFQKIQKSKVWGSFSKSKQHGEEIFEGGVGGRDIILYNKF